MYRMSKNSHVHTHTQMKLKLMLILKGKKEQECIALFAKFRVIEFSSGFKQAAITYGISLPITMRGFWRSHMLVEECISLVFQVVPKGVRKEEY